jgi:hypothetical protein
MSFRMTHPMPAIIEAVIATEEADWNDATRQTARTDAQRILEALVAEVSVDQPAKSEAQHPSPLCCDRILPVK